MSVCVNMCVWVYRTEKNGGVKHTSKQPSHPSLCSFNSLLFSCKRSRFDPQTNVGAPILYCTTNPPYCITNTNSSSLLQSNLQETSVETVKLLNQSTDMIPDIGRQRAVRFLSSLRICKGLKRHLKKKDLKGFM